MKGRAIWKYTTHPGTDAPSVIPVRAITEQHAEKLIDLLSNRDEANFRNGLAKYAEDFGEKAAAQLEAYARRQAHERSR